MMNEQDLSKEDRLKIIASAANKVLQSEKWELSISKNGTDDWFMSCQQRHDAPPTHVGKDPDQIQAKLLSNDIVQEAYQIVLAAHAGGVADIAYGASAQCWTCLEFYDVEYQDIGYFAFASPLQQMVSLIVHFECRACGYYVIDTLKTIDVYEYALHIIGEGKE